METYIAFLRGINVGGYNKVPMAKLREVLNVTGLHEVRTYIQSGNIVFKSPEKSVGELEQIIKKTIEDSFGFRVPTLVKSLDEVQKIIDDNPFTTSEYLESNSVYFTLLFDVPSGEQIRSFESVTYPNEEFKISDSCVYLLCKKGYGNAKLNNNLIERKLRVTATARNYRTMQKLLVLASYK
jgi:uncharacterized protein (DUF1697 family)